MAAADTSPRILGVWAGDGDNVHFLDPILERLPEHGYQVQKFSWSSRTSPKELWRQIASVDMAWFEWCNEPVFQGSRLVKDKPAVCRLHRYEAYQSYPQRVDWEGIDRLILVTPYMREILARMHPGVVPEEKMVVIPNAVDVEHIPYREHRKKGFRVGFMGRMHVVKNPMLALQVLARLVSIDSRYVMEVVGPPNHFEVMDYLLYQVQRMGLEKHFVYHNKKSKEEVLKWLGKIDYFLLTSVIEGHPVGVLEAMAAGVKPVIHAFPGADRLYPEAYLFNTIEEAAQKIVKEPIVSAEYRQFVLEHYNRPLQVRKIVEELNTLWKMYTTEASDWERVIARAIQRKAWEEAENILAKRFSAASDTLEKQKAHIWAIRLGIETRDYEYALLHAERALDNGPEDPAVYFWMAEALWKTGYPEGAAEAWVYAAELMEKGVSSAIDLDAAGVYRMAAEICQKVGQTEDALRFEVLAHM